MSDTKNETPAAQTSGAELAVQPRSEIEVVSNPNKAFLRKSAADLENAVALYPEDVRGATVWTQGFCREHCNGNIELLRAVAEKLGFKRSYAFFYNALNGYSYKPGKGKGDQAYWLELVAALREHDRSATATGKRGFIETPTYRCIANFIDERRAVNAPCKFGIITGPTGSQKSACRKYYRLLNNHGMVVGFEAPARQTAAALERKLGEQYSAKSAALAADRTAEVRRNLDYRKTVMIDNAQRMFIAGAGNRQPLFEYLLETQEDTDCTVILWVCEDFVDGDLTTGAAKKYFEQLVGRFGGMSDILRLPQFTPAADLRVIARSYGLKDGPSAMEYLKRWSQQAGRIRIVFHRLTRARNFAQLDGRDRITLDDLAEVDTYIPAAIGDDDGGES